MRILALAILFGLTGGARAQEIFVDGIRGKDTNPGTAALPFKSITKGASAMKQFGARLNIRTGFYGKLSTGEVFPIVIGRDKASITSAVIRGLGSVFVDLGKGSKAAFQVGPIASNVRITNLKFINTDTQPDSAVIVSVGTPAEIEIDRCVFESVSRGIVIQDGAWPHLHAWRVHNNVFYKIYNQAIGDYEVQGRNYIFNNTIVGNVGNVRGQVGIFMDSNTTVVDNNLVVGMKEGFKRGRNGNPAFKNNNVWNNGVDWAGTFNGKAPAGNFKLDPKFVDASKFDFHLQASSPLVDKGNASVRHRMDPDGVPGAVDGDQNGSVLPDIGAYERPVTTFAASYVAATGATTLKLTGPAGQVGFVLFALDDGIVHQTGFTLLLDVRSLFPVTTAPAKLPVTINATLPPQPPGWRLVMQGASVDTTSNRVHAANQQWIQW